MKVEVKKFGEILTSRPAGREAGLAIKAYLKPESGDNIELDFTGVLAMGPSWLDEVLSVLRETYGCRQEQAREKACGAGAVGIVQNSHNGFSACAYAPA